MTLATITAAAAATNQLGLAQKENTMVARKWSEIPQLLDLYRKLIAEKNQPFRFFGYASTIFNNKGFFPEGVTPVIEKNVAVPGMTVDMCVFAAAPTALRGTVQYSESGERLIHNIGLYPGIRRSADETAYGVNVIPTDLDAALKHFFKREFGKAKDGVNYEDLYKEGPHYAVVEALKRGQDEIELFQMEIIETQTESGPQYALMVSPNEKARFADIAMNLTPEQAAFYILDGYGYVRTMAEQAHLPIEERTKYGGSCHEEFVKLMGKFKEHGYSQPRLDKIAKAVKELAEAYDRKLELLGPTIMEESKRENLLQEISASGMPLDPRNVTSVIIPPDYRSEDRGPVTEEMLALTTKMPRTELQKLHLARQAVENGLFKDFGK